MRGEGSVKVANPFASLEKKSKSKKKKAKQDAAGTENAAEEASNTSADRSIEINESSTEPSGSASTESDESIISELMAFGYSEEDIVQCKQRLELGSPVRVDSLAIMKELQEEQKRAVMATLSSASSGASSASNGSQSGRQRKKKEQAGPESQSQPKTEAKRASRQPDQKEAQPSAASAPTDQPRSNSKQKQRRGKDKGEKSNNRSAANGAQSKGVTFAPKSTSSYTNASGARSGSLVAHQENASGSEDIGDDITTAGVIRQVNQWDPLSPNAHDLVFAWVFRLGSPSRDDEPRQRAFYESNATGLIVRKLVTEYFPTKGRTTGGELQKLILKLWDITLTGTPDYHRWLFENLRNVSQTMQGVPQVGQAFFLDKLATMFTEQGKFHTRNSAVDKLLQSEESSRRPTGRRGLATAAGQSVADEDVAAADARMMREFGITAQDFFGSANPEPLRRIWDSVVRSSTAVSKAEARLQKSTEVVASSSPSRDLQLAYHYLEKETKDELRTTTSAIESTRRDRDNLLQRKTTLNTRKREDLDRLTKQDSESASKKRDLQNRKRQLELELASVNVQLERIDQVAADAGKSQADIQARYLREENDIERLSADVNTSMTNLGRQKLAAEDVIRFVVAAYEKVKDMNVNMHNRLAEVSRSSVGDFVSGVQTHVMNCQDMIEFLTTRIEYVKSKLEQSKVERKELLARGVDASHLPGWEQSLNSMLKQSKSVTDRITNEISQLFARLSRISPSSPGADALANCRAMLSALEARHVVFDLTKPRSWVQSFEVHQQHQQQAIASAATTAPSATSSLVPSSSSTPSTSVSAIATVPTSTTSPLRAHSRAIQPPEKNLGGVNFPSAAALATPGGYGFAFPTPAPVPAPVPANSAASVSATQATSQSHSQPVTSVAVPVASQHQTTFALPGLASIPAGANTAAAVLVSPSGDDSTAVSSATAGLSQRAQRRQKNKAAYNSANAANTVNAANAAKSNGDTAAAAAKPVATTPAAATNGVHAATKASSSIAPAAAAAENATPASVAFVNNANLEALETKTPAKTGGSWANFAAHSNPDKAKLQLEQQAQIKAQQAQKAKEDPPAAAPPTKKEKKRGGR